MLIPQLLILAVSGIPFGLQNIYFNITNDIPKDDLRNAIEHLFVQIIRLFYHCNFVCPFYIYLYMSSEVRKVLKNYMIKSARCITDVTLNTITNTTQSLHA
ncbi:hypothetical protein I4U23_012222 [Adineta vaga]|nr:hypothetical protein I4U23_012222 [Adineta vaga]